MFRGRSRGFSSSPGRSAELRPGPRVLVIPPTDAKSHWGRKFESVPRPDHAFGAATQGLFEGSRLLGTKETDIHLSPVVASVPHGLTLSGKPTRACSPGANLRSARALLSLGSQPGSRGPGKADACGDARGAPGLPRRAHTSRLQRPRPARSARTHKQG